MSYNFTGKVALVTGSSSGIGRDIVTNLAKLGASVVVTGRNESRVKSVADEVKQVSTAIDSVKVISVVADLEKDDDIKTLIATTVKSFGHLDILVNNAGFGASATIFDDNFISVFESVFATNVLGVVKVTKEAVPYLLKSKGANIINISSVASSKPRPGGAPYCTSKAALDMITRCLCDELSPKGVRVNSINPAMIETPFFERSGRELEPLKKHFSTIYPIQRVGVVKDVTAACLYLASSDASFITGVMLPVDGGFLNAATF